MILVFSDDKDSVVLFSTERIQRSFFASSSVVERYIHIFLITSTSTCPSLPPSSSLKGLVPLPGTPNYLPTVAPGTLHVPFLCLEVLLGLPATPVSAPAARAVQTDTVLIADGISLCPIHTRVLRNSISSH